MSRLDRLRQLLALAVAVGLATASGVTSIWRRGEWIAPRDDTTSQAGELLTIVASPDKVPEINQLLLAPRT